MFGANSRVSGAISLRSALRAVGMTWRRLAGPVAWLEIEVARIRVGSPRQSTRTPATGRPLTGRRSPGSLTIDCAAAMAANRSSSRRARSRIYRAPRRRVLLRVACDVITRRRDVGALQTGHSMVGRKIPLRRSTQSTPDWIRTGDFRLVVYPSQQRKVIGTKRLGAVELAEHLHCCLSGVARRSCDRQSQHARSEVAHEDDPGGD